MARLTVVVAFIGAIALAGCAATVEPTSTPSPPVEASAAPEPTGSTLPSPSLQRPPISPPAGNPAPD